MVAWTEEDRLELAALLHSGLSHLAALDGDYARKENEIGFSARDTRFGHELVARGYENWTPKMLEAAFKLARYYKNTQLRGLGVDWDRPYVAADQAPKKEAGLRDGKIVFTFGYDPEIVARLKGVKARWDPAARVWWATLENDAARAEAASGDWEMTASLLGMLLSWVGQPKESEARVPEYLDFSEVRGTLRPFQIDGATWLVTQGRGILGDDMGTGKTLQALAAASAASAWPLLVICPAVVKINWAKECLKWLPNRRVSVLGERRASCVLDGETVAIECGNMDAEVVVVNYDIVSKLRGELGARKWGGLVCDESHYLKNHGAARTKHVTWLATGYDKDLRRQTREPIPFRWLLSGTPMLNRPIELVSQLTIIDRLRELGGFKRFVEQYCDPKHNGFAWDYSGASNTRRLGEAMGKVMLRRMKSEVLAELPVKTREYMSVKLSNEAVYRRAEAGVAQWVAMLRASDAAFLNEAYADVAAAGFEGEEAAAFVRRKIEEREASAKKTAERAEALVRFTALKTLAAEGKLDAVVEWVDQWLEANPSRKLVIFAHHRQIVWRLAQIWNAKAISGDTTSQERQAAVDEFQNDPRVRIIVCNIQAGGVGITLTAASDVLFVEQHWNPGTHDQAEDRVNRLGQHRACVAYYMLGEGTIDEEIAAMIEGKRKIVSEGTGDVVKSLGDWLVKGAR